VGVVFAGVRDAAVLFGSAVPEPVESGDVLGLCGDADPCDAAGAFDAQLEVSAQRTSARNNGLSRLATLCQVTGLKRS
jgi:hypothetical protein